MQKRTHYNISQWIQCAYDSLTTWRTAETTYFWPILRIVYTTLSTYTQCCSCTDLAMHSVLHLYRSCYALSTAHVQILLCTQYCTCTDLRSLPSITGRGRSISPTRPCNATLMCLKYSLDIMLRYDAPSYYYWGKRKVFWGKYLLHYIDNYWISYQR